VRKVRDLFNERIIIIICRNLEKPKSEDNELEAPVALDPYNDLRAMLDPKGKGYVILDGVERDSPTIAEILRIETE